MVTAATLIALGFDTIDAAIKFPALGELRFPTYS
jgi:hypothetical protein